MGLRPTNGDEDTLSEPRPLGSPEGLRPTNGDEDTLSEPRPLGSVGESREWQTLPNGRGSDGVTFNGAFACLARRTTLPYGRASDWSTCYAHFMSHTR